MSPRVRAAAAQEDPASSVPTLRDPRYSQSLERGLAILRLFTPARPVLGIAEIAGELGITRSTTHRYVVTLVELGYLLAAEKVAPKGAGFLSVLTARISCK